MTTSSRRIGRYIAFIPAHCKLEREFRTEMGKWLRASTYDMVYGDSLHPTNDKYEEPIQVLRPGWSPERLRGHCYVGDVVLATEFLPRIVGLRAGIVVYDGPAVNIDKTVLTNIYGDEDWTAITQSMQATARADSDNSEQANRVSTLADAL